MLAQRFVIVLVLALLMVGENCDAQVQVLFRISLKDTGEEHMDQFIASLKVESRLRLNVRIAEMDTVCALSPKQTQKLSVAARGAAVKFSVQEDEKHRKTLRTHQRQAGIDVEKLEEDKAKREAGEEIAEDDDEEDDENNKQIVRRNMAFIIQLNSAQKVEESKLWKQALKNVLTDEQTDLYADFLTQRNRIAQVGAVQQMVSKIDLKILLDDSQREEMRKVIDSEFGESLVFKLKSEPKRNNGFVEFNKQQNENDDYDHLVKEFLTEEQLKLWRALVVNELRTIQQAK